jgi:hypothetical protein
VKAGSGLQLSGFGFQAPRTSKFASDLRYPNELIGRERRITIETIPRKDKRQPLLELVRS